MFIVELMLPLDRGDGAAVPHSEVEAIITDLAEHFGGATAFTRSPAEGLWRDGGNVLKDRIIVVEVMVDNIDEAWWAEYRARMEKQLQQEEVLIRATPSRKL
jgi:hypothetical protein